MKQFSLEEFKKNPNRKVVTRDGLPVKIIYTEAEGNYPVIALIRSLDNEDYPWRFRNDGTLLENEENDSDLFFAPEKVDGWVNVYKESEDYIRTGATVFKTKEEAIKHINGAYYIATIHIEFEEEQP